MTGYDLSSPALVRADERPSPSDWASLVADLSLGGQHRETEWRIHDRTHLEFALDYHLREGETVAEFEWDSYFFVPESLRLHDQTYEKHEIYDDLQSYVRFAVPQVRFDALAAEPLDALKKAIGSSDTVAAVREMRLFACLVRSSGVAAQRAIIQRLGGDTSERAGACEAALDLARTAQGVSSTLRAALEGPERGPEPTATAARWVDEDVSRVLETVLAQLSIELRNADVPPDVASAVAMAAVEEARYRKGKGLDGIGTARAAERDVEHLEFRRHQLKRFTSSALWLKMEIRQAAVWILHLVNAIAASVAMIFFFFAALPSTNRGPVQGNLWMWALLVVSAYAVKDRIKAFLQSAFSTWVSRFAPDRRWRILDAERKVELGRVRERSGFVGWKRLPRDVLAARRLTRKHSLEEQARPERVLWHHKSCLVRADRVAEADPRFHALTEIFRLNLRRWLDHTDDPKRKIVFADPDDRHIYSSVAPRVYNIAVVYRFRRRSASDVEAPWHRIRVVVTRKGIRRVDRIC